MYMKLSDGHLNSIFAWVGEKTVDKYIRDFKWVSL